MKVNTEGKIEIDAQDIFDNLPKDSVLELIEKLSCSELVIKHVADQLLEGCTENGYCGYTCISLNPSAEINIARDKIAKGSDTTARNRILELEILVKRAEDLTKSGWDAYHKLNRSINEICC